LQLGLSVAALVGALALIFTVGSDSPALRLNQMASETVVAQRQVTYADKAATEARRQHVMNAVLPAYTFDPSRAEARTLLAITFVTRVGRVLATSGSPSGKQAAILRLTPADITPDALQQFPVLKSADFKVVKDDVRSLMLQAETWRFSRADIQPTELGLLSSVAPRLTRDQRIAVTDVLVSFLAPTLTLDAARTQALRAQAAAKVFPVHVTIYPGEVVIRRGDIVTPSILEKLTALGIRERITQWNDVLASLLFAALVVVMLFWYLHTFHSEILAQPRLVLLIDASILVTALTARFLTAGHVLLPFLLPVAAASTFAAVLIAPEACVAVTLAMALLAGWVVSDSFELAVYYFLTGAAGVLAIRRVRQVKQFMLAGIYIMAFGLGTALAFGLVNHSYDFAAFREYVLAAGFNGFVSSALALGGFAVLSNFFGVTTALQLLELSQPNRPLLRRLMVRAPGTYHHSVFVASMAEHAAEEIGADSLLVKVGALYHDIGKTANPHCFVENQMGLGNIHDELRSDESARIIRGHVTQGMRLARQFDLPPAVLEVIAEHHGTMALTYFLHKAQLESQGLPIDRSVYVYPGPKPQTRETALIMLADGCESAVRAASDHSNDKMREIVERIFEERIQQGQLDECPLTLHDLETAKYAYCTILGSLYHPRIEYPELPEPPLEAPRILGTGRGA
jgi:putative nucleotidyltransferase with HDIG domain